MSDSLSCQRKCYNLHLCLLKFKKKQNILIFCKWISPNVCTLLMYEIVSFYLEFGKYTEENTGFIQGEVMGNDTVIHVLLSAYCELLHFIANYLNEYLNDLTRILKIFSNKIENEQNIIGVCLIVWYSEIYCLSYVKVFKLVAELERYSLN